MTNNIIGTFTEEAYCNGKIFNLQTREIEPCTEEEKRIYGVDVKLRKNRRRARIVEFNCHDGGVFYEIQIDWQILHPIHFQDLNNAKEYLINKAKELKLL